MLFVLMLFKLKHGFQKLMGCFLVYSHSIWHLSIIKKKMDQKLLSVLILIPFKRSDFITYQFVLNFIFEIRVKGENFCFGANKTVYQTLWEGILKGKRIFPIINLEIHCVSLCPMCHTWWNSDIQGPLTVTCAEISMDINVWP